MTKESINLRELFAGQFEELTNEELQATFGGSSSSYNSSWENALAQLSAALETATSWF
ncbi:hypothetical protein [Lactococcus hircilactis]|uniref:hypothetical protein n=1 Tax=Lactococcus hircilactis TaxID=1494462 RepID=UPI003FA31328